MHPANQNTPSPSVWEREMTSRSHTVRQALGVAELTAGLNAEPSASVWDRPRFFDIAREIATASTADIEAMLSAKRNQGEY